MKLYNSLTNNKQTFTPLSKEKVSIYVCGITPYDTTHLGHAFTYILFDILIRYLKFLGYKVDYTQNVTDINDRDGDILKRAKEQNISWQELSDYWTSKFLEDMESLNWTKPTNYLYASKQIQPMVDLIEKLVNSNYAYAINGSVYFDVSKKKDFGKLSKFNRQKMLEISKDFEEDLDNPDKKDPLDITLWRTASLDKESHIPSFYSPWGKGRPGWHLECSAMSISSLGEQIDIHGGGVDLIYPHHESEIAQSEGATQKTPFANFWIHTGTVFYAGEKMSKSKGNLVMVSDLLKKYSPNSIRWLLLSHHYRKPWEFFEEDIIRAEQETKKIFSLAKTAPSVQIPDSFRQAMEDDLDTPKVLGIIRDTKNPSHLAAFLSILGFKI